MAALSFSSLTSRFDPARQCKSSHVSKLIGASPMVKFFRSRINSCEAPIRLHGGNISRGRVVTCCAAQATTELPSEVGKMDFKKLQNGSDIRGVAVAGVEGEPVNLTEPVAEAIGTAFVQWLLTKKKAANVAAQMVIAIGHDSRVSASVLEKAIARGITNAGAIVVLYGLASTPAMFNSTVTQKDELVCPADGAIMITASHLPYNRNGFKFFVDTGGLGKADITDILSRASNVYNDSSSGTTALGASPDTWKRVNFMDHYAGELVKAVRNAAGSREKPLEGFHIVVDAGNGAGGFFTEKVLQPLGAVTEGSQFLEPDGMFPNHIPNPEDKKAMEAITSAVLKHKADLGIIFDTDVDRSAAVDSSGRELNRNRLIALISAIILAERPGTTIVTDSVTSDGLTDFIEKKLGGKHHRFKRGYKNVIDEAIRLLFLFHIRFLSILTAAILQNTVGEETHLAMETSGHGALKENRWLDDGAYLMVKLLIKLAAAKAAGEGQGSSVLTNLIKDLEEVDFATELRLKINETHPDIGSRTFREYGDEVLRHLDASLASNPDLKKPAKNFEGVRASGYGGFFLLRLSLHDPVLPLNIEATSQEGIRKLARFVLDTVSGFKALDVSSLAKFVNT